MAIGQTLREIRIELGFKSARAFYRHLSAQGRLDFNYSYYMRIEGNKALPSPSVVSTIGNFLGIELSDRLTLAYCASLFPKKSHLFKGTRSTAKIEKIKSNSPMLQKQKELTPFQIATIGKSKFHYYLFLLLTLAREPVNQDILGRLLSVTDANVVITDLSNAKIAYLDYDRISSFVKEFKFPKAASEEQQIIYKRFDEWDLTFYKDFDFNTLLKKILIRRVSSRFLTIILSQCNTLLDLVRASEETDQSYNNEILQLTITMTSGTLPG